jgi:hypothetical protein
MIGGLDWDAISETADPENPKVGLRLQRSSTKKRLETECGSVVKNRSRVGPSVIAETGAPARVNR